jgi:hypothetical protein
MSMFSKPRRQFDLLAVLILLIGISMPVVIWYLATRPAAPAPTIAAPPANPPPTAQLISATRELKLVTMTIESRIRVNKTDERWRGTASATIEAPVKYFYGVDLAKVDDHAFSWNPLTSTRTLNIGPPVLIAIEVDGSHPISEKVDVTGTRFKSMSGAEQLNLAQKALYEAARTQQISNSDLEKVRIATREQIERSLLPIMGPSARISVKFSDE